MYFVTTVRFWTPYKRCKFCFFLIKRSFLYDFCVLGYFFLYLLSWLFYPFPYLSDCFLIYTISTVSLILRWEIHVVSLFLFCMSTQYFSFHSSQIFSSFKVLLLSYYLNYLPVLNLSSFIIRLFKPGWKIPLYFRHRQ